MLSKSNFKFILESSIIVESNDYQEICLQNTNFDNCLTSIKPGAGLFINNSWAYVLMKACSFINCTSTASVVLEDVSSSVIVSGGGCFVRAFNTEMLYSCFRGCFGLYRGSAAIFSSTLDSSIIANETLCFSNSGMYSTQFEINQLSGSISSFNTSNGNHGTTALAFSYSPHMMSLMFAMFHNNHCSYILNVAQPNSSFISAFHNGIISNNSIKSRIIYQNEGILSISQYQFMKNNLSSPYFYSDQNTLFFINCICDFNDYNSSQMTYQPDYSYSHIVFSNECVIKNNLCTLSSNESYLNIHILLLSSFLLLVVSP